MKPPAGVRGKCRKMAGDLGGAFLPRVRTWIVNVLERGAVVISWRPLVRALGTPQRAGPFFSI